MKEHCGKVELSWLRPSTAELAYVGAVNTDLLPMTGQVFQRETTTKTSGFKIMSCSQSLYSTSNLHDYSNLYIYIYIRRNMLVSIFHWRKSIASHHFLEATAINVSKL